MDPLSTPYDHLVDVSPIGKGTDADDLVDVWLWASLYEYGEGQIPEPCDVAEIPHLHAHSPEGYGSVYVAALMRLRDDRWATVVASCDTTGFDCRGSADWRINSTKASAVAYGLDREARRALGLRLKAER